MMRRGSDLSIMADVSTDLSYETVSLQVLDAPAGHPCQRTPSGCRSTPLPDDPAGYLSQQI